jgi:hypothetical protein
MRYETTIGGILESYLRENGFDGLAYDDCGCGIDDLFPCEQPTRDCQAAYRRSVMDDSVCRDCGDRDYCLDRADGGEIFCTKSPGITGSEDKVTE